MLKGGIYAGMLLLSAAAGAQSIHVESAPTNQIRPTEALGSSVDRLPYGVADKVLADPILSEVLAAGWQPITYRQNTELHAEAWHWNPAGSWSAGKGRGYFTGSAELGEPINHSYGYPLPRRGITRDDGTDVIGFSRLTDGDPDSFWKSNPYLTKTFTGEDDSTLPQWVMLDLSVPQPLDAIRIAWGQPYATHYAVQYWMGTDPVHKPGEGEWKIFPHGAVNDGKGGDGVLRLADLPVTAQFIRISMSQSSNACQDGPHSDVRDCVGYSIRELYLGTQTEDGAFHDLIRHTPDQDQTATWCSSVDPWHEEKDLNEKAGDQTGFDLFYRSGITRGLPAMIPIAMIYNTPEDAANQIAYIEKRGYPISYVEMGEESDGHYMTPEDNAALYIQFARALHKVDPKLKLGGPVFTGENEDIEVWADGNGDSSWTRRWLTYLKAHGALGDLAFFSFEHYPIKPGKVVWSSLYDEPELITHIMKVWREDGVPASTPLFITESNLSSSFSEAYMDVFGGLWLADYVGAFLAGGGAAVYHFHDIPAPISPGFYTSPGTFAFLSLDQDMKVKQRLSQFHASQLITQAWVQPGSGLHGIFPASSDIEDGTGRKLVTVYATQRPDGLWSLMIVNKDQENAYKLPVEFGKGGHFTGQVSVSQWGRAQYQWHADGDAGHADPDNPPVVSSVSATAGTQFTLPPASITVLRGKVELTR